MSAKYILLLAYLITPLLGYAQNLNGVVYDRGEELVFAANVYLKSSPQNGVITDLDGSFNLNITDQQDTLVVSFIGFQTKEIPVFTIDVERSLKVVLSESVQFLGEVVVKAQDPISEQFSVVRMKKMDIYLNPVAQGDPLKAITSLPASTATDETVNPSLRGSSADRSRVILNGVPIYNPVRASNLSNQGFFSLFNPEVIDKQYVYASNPPLIYGNTSAGLVDIQTQKKIASNQLNLSLSLASTGLLMSHEIKKDRSFIQAYGNYQFSNLFTGIQKAYLPKIIDFKTKDLGVNFRQKIGKSIDFNSFSYFISEQFNGRNREYTYQGNVKTQNKRFFTVNNLVIHTSKGTIQFNAAWNTSSENFSFGNIKSLKGTQQYYFSAAHKSSGSARLNIQYGISYDGHHNNFQDSIPIHYYALAPDAPNYYVSSDITNHILEAYLYAKRSLSDRWLFSSGIRRNISFDKEPIYWSTQFSLKYDSPNKHAFLISGGKYYSYSTPSFYTRKYQLLSSFQLALDYSYTTRNSTLKAAAYIKDEKGEQYVNFFLATPEIKTIGIEFFIESQLSKYLKFTFANSFIDQNLTVEGEKIRGPKDFNYLIKANLQYYSAKWFSLAIAYSSRPGTSYQSIVGSSYHNDLGVYEPHFSTDLNAAEFGSYHRFDISLSKYLMFKKYAFITFFSLNNVFNHKNQNAVNYTSDYQPNGFDYFQLRTLYFGVVWQG